MALAMAAPRSAPAGARESHHYSSPDVVPAAWSPDRPGMVDGLQPVGPRMGTQGPDQGFALRIAERLVPKIRLQGRERLDDAIRGCLGIALRRASLFGRVLVEEAPDRERDRQIVQHRRPQLFEGVGNVHHHYAEGRAIADSVPESTLRMTPDQVASAYPARWRELTGA